VAISTVGESIRNSADSLQFKSNAANINPAALLDLEFFLEIKRKYSEINLRPESISYDPNIELANQKPLPPCLTKSRTALNVHEAKCLEYFEPFICSFLE